MTTNGHSKKSIKKSNSKSKDSSKKASTKKKVVKKSTSKAKNTDSVKKDTDRKNVKKPKVNSSSLKAKNLKDENKDSYNLAKANNYILVIIAIAAITTLALVVFPNAIGNNKAAAYVNGQAISIKELEQEYKLYQSVFSVSDQSVFSKRIMLNLMIDEKLLLQEAKKNGFDVTETELDNYIQFILDSSAVPMTMQDFKNEFKKNNISYEQVENLYEKQLLLNKYLNGTILSKIEVTDEEVRALYESRDGSDMLDYETVSKALENVLYEQKKETMYKELIGELKNESVIKNLLYEDMSNFARCLSKKGIIIYGVYTDAQTQRQKQSFGQDFSYLNYVECKDPNTGMTKKECLEYKRYPVWLINEKEVYGFQTVDHLSDLTGCAIN